MRRRAFAAALTACSAMVLAGPLEAGSKFKQEGMASWYKMGTRTANGERYDPNGITAAHPSLPFDTKVRVTNAMSGKSVVVRINDRGPFTGNRIIDLSHGAANVISLTKAGVAKVKLEVLGAQAETDTVPVPKAKPVELASAEIQPVARPVTAKPALRLREDWRMGSLSR